MVTITGQSQGKFGNTGIPDIDISKCRMGGIRMIQRMNVTFYVTGFCSPVKYSYTVRNIS